jgi:Phage endonuclease I
VAAKGRKPNVGTTSYRSGLEVKVADQLSKLGIKAEYETLKIKYTVPEKVHTYTPDFALPNGIIIETKGKFDLADRSKHLLVKSQYPNLDIRFVFTNSKTKIRKGSPTSYGDWAARNGFLFADKLIPKEWLDE